MIAVAVLSSLVVFSFSATGCRSLSVGSQLGPAPWDPRFQSTPSTDAESISARRVLAEAVDASPDVLFGASGQGGMNLASAVAQGVVNNLSLAAAGHRVNAASANELQARSLLLPNLLAGCTYRAHDGPLINSTGFIFDGPLQSAYVGAGAAARGGGTVTNPGVRLFAHLGDVFFEPDAAGCLVRRESAAQAGVGNQMVLEIETAYLAMAVAKSKILALKKSEVELKELRRVVQNIAKVGQGRDGDVHRVDAELLLIQTEIQRATEEAETARIQLGRIIRHENLDTLHIADSLPIIPDAVDAERPLDDLLDQAFVNRPELASLREEVSHWEIRTRQESWRPILPTVAVGFSAGWYGGSGAGTQNRFTALDARTDLDVALIWSANGLGVGNHATTDAAYSKLCTVQWEFARLRDLVFRQIVQARTEASARHEELKTTVARVTLSQDGFARDMTRLKNLQVRPIEVLSSQVQLSQARHSLIQSMSGYAQALFQLEASLGNH